MKRFSVYGKTDLIVFKHLLSLLPSASAERRSMYGKYSVKIVSEVIVQYVFTQKG